ncbi:LPS export ABC transporter periplasmic protein LptC [Segetibacter sp. 3557_3]|nr:LPS export ABC transporter periplasmic protein LptC [Segetibacter sp. 3557_3]
MISRFIVHKRVLAALLTGCFFVLSCENDMSAVQELSKKKIGVEEAKNIESYLSQDAKLKAKLTAPSMLRYQFDTPKVEFPKSLHVNFYNDSLKVESELSADYGRYLENENKVFLRDSVVVFNKVGDTLHCKELYWDQRQESFYTDKNVILLQPSQKLYGKGLRARQDFKGFTIIDPTGFILIPDSTWLGY